VLDGSVATVNNSNSGSEVQPASIEDRAEPVPARARRRVAGARRRCRVRRDGWLILLKLTLTFVLYLIDEGREISLIVVVHAKNLKPANSFGSFLSGSEQPTRRMTTHAQ
jgi:hypothetical protein